VRISEKLLGADVADGARQGGDHEGKPLGDPAGVDPRAVQRDAGFTGDGVHPPALVRWGVEPPQWGDEVLVRLEDGGHHAGIGEQRAIEDAFGVRG